MNFDLVIVVLLVIYLEGVLSIDNAAVLGALVSSLPESERIPWPRALNFLTQPMHRLLGGQRAAALKVGLLGAYAGQFTMLILANYIIQNPWLKLVGGLYLIKLAIENLGEPEPGEEEQVELGRASHRSFWNIVLMVELSDLAFSLDNVVAVVAISKNLAVIIFGVALAIVLLRFAAGIFARLILWEPLLKPAAYVIVLIIGVELWTDELYGIHIDNVLQFFISVSTLLIAVAYARFKPLHKLGPFFYWLGEGLADLNELFDWALQPFTWLGRAVLALVLSLGRRFFSPSRKPSPAMGSGMVAAEGNEESSV